MMEATESLGTMSEEIRQAASYHQWIFDTLRPDLVHGTVLEVGSGHGIYARKLAAMMSRVLVSDIDPTAVERIRATLADLTNIDYLVMDGVDPARISSPVDNIFLVNVLEHIADDRGLLRSAHAALRPDGRLILLVPAFPLLFSKMDAQAGHHRRYRREELASAVREAGFDVIQAKYFNAVGFFGWLANRWMGSGLHDAKTNAQIRVFDRLVPVFRSVDRLLPFVGQSVIVTARKARAC